jgi:hypothetical protein
LESRADQAKREQAERVWYERMAIDEEYLEWCNKHGFDPDDPTIARSYFGEADDD